MGTETIRSYGDAKVFDPFQSPQGVGNSSEGLEPRATSERNRFFNFGIKKLEHRSMAAIQSKSKGSNDSRFVFAGEKFFLNRIVAKLFGFNNGVPSKFAGGLASPYLKLRKMFRSGKVEAEVVKEVKGEIKRFVQGRGTNLGAKNDAVEGMIYMEMVKELSWRYTKINGGAATYPR